MNWRFPPSPAPKMDDCAAIRVKIKDIVSLQSFKFEKRAGWELIRLQALGIIRTLITDTKFEIALEETVMNAVSHGNSVRVKINKLKGSLILRVRDDGSGFNGARP